MPDRVERRPVKDDAYQLKNETDEMIKLVKQALDDEEYTDAHEQILSIRELYKDNSIQIPPRIEEKINNLYNYLFKLLLTDASAFIKDKDWETAQGCIDELKTIFDKADRIFLQNQLNKINDLEKRILKN